MTAQKHPVNLVILMTVLVMVTAAQRAGLVTVLQTVKIRRTAVISPVMIMTAATAVEEMILVMKKLSKCTPAA
jgi:hypothetical protein